MRIFVVLTVAAAACSNAVDPGSDAAIPIVGRPDASTTDARPSGEDAAAPPASYAGLVINEVAATGTPDDWFELYNGSAAPIDLGGVTYSDEPNAAPTKGLFPSGTVIAAGEYLVVTVNDTSPGFKLGSDEALGVLAPNGATIDLVDWAEGDSPAGASYGRIPNATGPFRRTSTPTPGAANVDGANPCGNGAIDGAEACDGSALGAHTCVSEGFASGVLACSADCAALVTAGCVASTAAADVAINELSSAGNDPIELVNRGAARADLAGWYVHDADFVLGDPTREMQRYVLSGTIAAGGYRVLVKGTQHGFGLGAADGLTLRRADDSIADATQWTAGQADPSWCRLPDRSGAFAPCRPTFGAQNGGPPAELCGDGIVSGAERCDGAALDGHTCASEGFAGGAIACLAGCGGFDTTSCRPRVVINELTSSGDDRIEIYAAQAASLTGWWIADSGYVPADPSTADHRYDFAAGASIAAAGYLVLIGAQDHMFGLGSTDGLELHAPTSTAAVDGTSWTNGGAAISYCRIPDGSGAFQSCATATFGAANQSSVSGRVVINEATSDGNDAIELYNTGAAGVVIDGWSVIDSDPTNTPYVFPAGTTIGPGAFMVLVKGVQHTFGLGGTDGVTLRDASAANVDSTAWTAGASPSWCRHPDGTGAFATCAAVSFGAANGP